MAALRLFLKDSRRLYGDQGFPLHLTTDGINYTGTREEGEDKQRALRSAELVRLAYGIKPVKRPGCCEPAPG